MREGPKATKAEESWKHTQKNKKSSASKLTEMLYQFGYGSRYDSRFTLTALGTGNLGLDLRHVGSLSINRVAVKDLKLSYHNGYIGIMEKKVETTIMGLYRV